MKTENYFLNCHTEESIAIRYKSLAKKYHPDVNKAPEATETFQEIAKQREQALRAVLIRSGKSEADINEYITSVFAGDRKMMQKLTDQLTDEIMEKFGDKEPNFKDVLNHLLGKTFGGKKNVTGENPGDQKKLQ